MDQETIKRIIEDGTYAISGDNSQPWRFEVSSNEIIIFNIPERDNPILNVRKRGSYIAHGALIENIIISAGNNGYGTDLQLLPEGSNSNVVARFLLHPAEATHDPLYDYIRVRASNRRPYDAHHLLTAEQKSELLAAADKVGKGILTFVEQPELKKAVGNAMSSTEKVALTTKELHYLFFKDMVWSEQEELIKKTGLYIKTLELPPPVRLLFRVLKYWPVMKVLNMLGFYKLAAMGNAQNYSSCALFGAIIVKDTDESFITAGRITQRVWLAATRMGLSFQVVTGVPFLYQRMRQTHDIFVPWQEKLIAQAYATLKESFSVHDGIIAMLFRTGYAKPPSARSSRLKPHITFLNAN